MNPIVHPIGDRTRSTAPLNRGRIWGRKMDVAINATATAGRRFGSGAYCAAAFLCLLFFEEDLCDFLCAFFFSMEEPAAALSAVAAWTGAVEAIATPAMRAAAIKDLIFNFHS